MSQRSRPDGAQLVRDLSELRQFLPLVMPTRTGAALYFHLPVDVSDTLRWLESEAGAETRFFHVFVAAVVRTFAERPQLNRYVLDGRIYQRDRIALSFAVKRGYRDDAELRMVKVELPATASLADVRQAIDAAITAGRSGARTTSETEMAWLNRAPRWMARRVVGLVNAADRRGLVPAGMIDADPTHASAMITNLGSIGLGASFHHLSDQGTASMVVALGTVGPQPVVGPDGELAVGELADIKFAIDDRIVDGFYCGRSLARFQHHLQHPAALVRRREYATHTIVGRLFDHAARHPERPAYYSRTGEVWSATTMFTYAEEVHAIGQALVGAGVGKGDRVVLKAYNRPEWAVFYLAAMAVGAIPAAVHDDAPPSELTHVLDDASPVAVLVEDAAALAVVRDTLGSAVTVVAARGAVLPDDDAHAHHWTDFADRGRATDDGEVDRRLAALQPDDIAVLVYTSGTTGVARGAMLTHDNLAWTASQAAQLFGGADTDRTVSYLPLSHIAEQMFTICVPLTTGAAVYFAPTRHGLFDTLREVQPTALFGVPRVWRRLADEVRRAFDAVASERGSWLVDRARATAEAALAAEEEGRVGRRLQVRFAAAQRAVLEVVRDRVGLRNVRHAITGAAAIDAETVRLFASLGVALRETYGQTEGCGPTTFNAPGRTRTGTVGPAFPGVEVTVAGGEILARGRNVFAGYWRDEAATRAAFRDGWLVTGDQGQLDDDGFLTLTGRVKELLVTEGGENVAPAALEASLEGLSLVDQAVVLGDARPYLTALFALDLDAAVSWLADRGQTPMSALASDDRVRAALDGQVTAWNASRAKHERIRRFHVLEGPLTAEDGELTATLKLRRPAIASRHADAIEAMYRSSPVRNGAAVHPPPPPPVDVDGCTVELGGYVARPVRDEAEAREAFALRYRTFLGANHIEPSAWPDELLRDRFDDHAQQFVVRDAADELVGTVRLVLPGSGLPVESLFRFPALERSPEQVGEIGRLAIDPRWRNRRAPLRALVRILLEQGQAQGLTHFYAFVPARTMRGYRALGYTTWEIPCDDPDEQMHRRREAMAPYFASQDPRVIVFTHLADAQPC